MLVSIVYHSLSLQTVWTQPMQNCDTCPRFPANRITHVTSHATGHTFVLGCKNLGCKTANMMYVISCDICGKQYVGATGNALNIRMNNHRTTIRSTSGQSQHKLPVGRHFRLRDDGITTFTIVPLEHNTNWSKEQRKHKKNILDIPNAHYDAIRDE
jgi:hypothetical protein